MRRFKRPPLRQRLFGSAVRWFGFVPAPPGVVGTSGRVVVGLTPPRARLVPRGADTSHSQEADSASSSPSSHVRCLDRKLGLHRERGLQLRRQLLQLREFGCDLLLPALAPAAGKTGRALAGGFWWRCRTAGVSVLPIYLSECMVILNVQDETRFGIRGILSSLNRGAGWGWVWRRRTAARPRAGCGRRSPSRAPSCRTC